MYSPVKMIFGFLVALFLGVIAVRIVLHFVFGLLALVLGLAVPVLVVGGLGYLAYRMFSPNALGGSRRILP